MPAVANEARNNITANPFELRDTKADLKTLTSHASPLTTRSTRQLDPEELTPMSASQS